MAILTRWFVLFSLFLPSLALASWGLDGMDWESVPRVILGPGDENTVRESLDREPYITIYKRVVDKANRSYDLENHDVGPEQVKASIAMSAAFVYLIDRKVISAGRDYAAVPFDTPAERDEYGARAELLLQNMHTLSRMTSFSNGGLDIHTSQELLMYAAAYDTLRGAGYTFEQSDLCTENVVSLASDFYKDWTHDLAGPMNAYNENHMSKSASSLGMAAIALNGYEPAPEDELGEFKHPEEWIDFGVKRTEFIILDALVSREGAYSESSVYYGYTAINHIPFMQALNRYTDGRGWDVDGVHYDDLLTDPRNAEIHDWLVRIRQPDGRFPPFDDCTPNGSYTFGNMSALPNAGLYRWAWEHQSTAYSSGGSIPQDVFILTNYDDSISAVSPDEFGWSPTQFLFDGGQAVFRSSWSEDATYMILLAEHGIAGGWAREKDYDDIQGAGGHEHIDPGQIHLFAHGKALLMDAGYLGWSNHEKVNNAYNHNILLVDDKGPGKPYLVLPELGQDENGEWIVIPGKEGGWVPGDDGEAYLTQQYDGTKIDMARVKTRYFKKVTDTEWTRTALFINDNYFAVIDEVETLDGSEHSFTMQWHGNGGGTSGGTFDDSNHFSASWINGDAGVEVGTIALGQNQSYSNDEQIHDAGSWAEQTHSRWMSHSDGSKVIFGSFIVPFLSEEEDMHIVIPTCAAADMLCLGADITDGATQFEGQLTAIGSEEAGNLGCEGTVAKSKVFASFCQRDVPRDDSPWTGIDALFMLEGTEISKSGQILVQSDVPISLLLEYSGEAGETWSGRYWVKDGGEATISIAGLPQNVEVKGICNEGGMKLVGSGDFSIKATDTELWHLHTIAKVEASLEAPNPWNPIPHVMVGDEVKIDAERTCNASGSPALSFELTEKPFYSEASISDTGLIVPDFPGDYFVEVTSSQAREEDKKIVRFHALPSQVDGDEEESESETELESEGDGDMELELEADAEAWELEESMEEDGDLDDESTELEKEEQEPVWNTANDKGCNCRSTGNEPALIVMTALALILGMLRRRRFDT